MNNFIPLMIVLIIGAGIPFCIAKHMIRKQTKIEKEYKRKLGKQLKLPYQERLPLYASSQRSTTLVISIVISVITIEFGIALLYGIKQIFNLPNSFEKIYYYVIILLPLTLFLPDYIMRKNCKKNFNKKYNKTKTEVLDSYSGEIHSICPIELNIERFGADFAKEYSLTVSHNNNNVKIGNIRIQKSSYSSEASTYIINYDYIFVELNTNYYFDKTIYVKNYDINNDVLNENTMIIPKYANIPIIRFKLGEKKFVEKIINDDVQKQIAKLATKIDKYEMIFYKNTIGILLYNASFPVPVVELESGSVVTVCEEIIKTLEIISEEIKKVI